MIVLNKAIITRFNGDSMSDTFTGMYFLEAKPSATYPYVVFSYPSQKHDLSFTQRFEDFLVQFDIFTDKSSAEVYGEYYNLLIGDEDLQTGFDYAEFDVEGYYLLGFERMNVLRSKTFEENKSIVCITVNYKCLLEKQ